MHGDGCGPFFLIILIIVIVMTIVIGESSGFRRPSRNGIALVVGEAPPIKAEKPPAPPQQPASAPPRTVPSTAPKTVDDGLTWPLFDLRPVTMGFWFFAAVAYILMLVGILHDNGEFAVSVFIVFIVLVEGLGGSGGIAYLWKHPTVLLAILAFHIAGGVVYASTRWFLFVHECLEPYRRIRALWLRDRGVADKRRVPAHLRYEWRQAIQSNSILQEANLRPLARTHRRQIIQWIAFWPVLLPWSIGHDTLIGAGKFMYSRVAHTFQRISDWVWRDVDADLEPEPKHESIDPEI
jgi:hypothetical protein